MCFALVGFSTSTQDARATSVRITHVKSLVPTYPPGTFNAHFFQLFNAIAFQIVLGAPIVLYAKSLGASSTVLGVLAAFTPLMTVFQLPAAWFLDRYTYRQFVLGGWGLRTVFIFVMALIPMLSFLDNTSKLALLLANLFFFNLLRGISSAGWMPWITAIIPDEVRGRFLSIDQIFLYVGSLFALLISAKVMHGNVDDWEFSAVFVLSAMGGTLSLVFIKRIPDAPAGELTMRSAQAVPWHAILAYLPFYRLIIFNLLFMAVVGSLGVFTVEFLREFEKFEADAILYLSAVSFLGPLLTLPFTGRMIDSAGSKPIFAISLAIFLIVIAGWFLVAAKLLPCTVMIVGSLNLLAGLAGANFNVANVRITMATMPEMGRNHFFAMFTVITSLGLGGAPIIWGLTLDAIGSYEAITGWFTWRRHSIYFAALFGITIVALIYVRALIERRSSSDAERLFSTRHATSPLDTGR